MSNRIISEILEEPDAFFLIQEVQSALASEKARRIAFYNEITEQEKAEFINGEVIVHSPVMIEHNSATLLLAQLMNIYNIKNKLGFVGVEKIMIQLTRNDYEPDICFFKKEKSGQFKRKQTLFPAPDWVIEILSDGTKGRDRGVKYKDYQAHRVEEYWIVNADEKTVEQYHLEEGKYELKRKLSDGLIKSYVMDGFQIPVEAIFDESANVEAIKNLV